MALRKSQLYSFLWESCDQLRGGMDGSQYKDYVLTLLFMKYVSDKYAGQSNPIIEVPVGGTFADMVACKGQKDIGDRINKIVGRLAKANDLRGVIDQADFNDDSKLGRGKAMQDRLTKLVAIFGDLDFKANRASGDDLLGDAYEYLMRHFATESGKAKGQFYTPAEVSRIMAAVIGIGHDTPQDYTIYDPTCGSGSLLLKAADQAPRSLTIYGQEMDNATYGLARMNMILHEHPTADLKHGDTLADPLFTSDTGDLKTFDFAVANPPFSTKSWSNGFDPMNDQYNRFALGVPPHTNGDYAWLLHLVKSLKAGGRGAIILPHGVLFRAKREAHIRRNLVEHGLIKGVIGLPANLFYGTSISACIVVIDKNNARARRGIFMIDAARGFRKDGAKNRLRARDIHQVIDVFNSQTTIPRYSRMVPIVEIANPINCYNLNIARYIDSSISEDIHDLDAHLNGGIPDHDLDALHEYWKVLPSLRSVLFMPSVRQGYSELHVARQDLRTTVLDHEESRSYKLQIRAVFNAWCDTHRARLRAISASTDPRGLLQDLAEDMLDRFHGLPLLDCYDIYQCLMDYWERIMQDDVYLVAATGWVEANQPRRLLTVGKGKLREIPDLTVGQTKWKMDLIAPTLMMARYFASDEVAVEALRESYRAVVRKWDALLEEHGGVGGILEGVADANGKVTKKRLRSLVQPTGNDRDQEALVVHGQCSRLLTEQAKALRAANAARYDLDKRVLAKYKQTSELAVKELVIEDKWRDDLWKMIDANVQRALISLVDRIELLTNRYAYPLPELEQAVASHSHTVMAHVAQMGIRLRSDEPSIRETDMPNDYGNNAKSISRP